MSNPRYPEEFKIQAVNQVTEKKLPVADVAARLGVSTHSLIAFVSTKRAAISRQCVGAGGQAGRRNMGGTREV